jgi:hypothetical protein
MSPQLGEERTFCGWLGGLGGADDLGDLVWVMTECHDPYQGPSLSDRAFQGLNLGPG